MAEAIKINTGKYKKEGKVDIDGHIWDVNLPGAGTELKLSQAMRRVELLQKKVENGSATEEDLDKMEDCEATIYHTFENMFKDGTEGNDEVRLWMANTPMAVINMAFEDIKVQANASEPTPSGS